MKVVQGLLETSDQMVGGDIYWPAWPCLNYLKTEESRKTYALLGVSWPAGGFVDTWALGGTASICCFISNSTVSLNLLPLIFFIWMVLKASCVSLPQSLLPWRFNWCFSQRQVKMLKHSSRLLKTELSHVSSCPHGHQNMPPHMERLESRSAGECPLTDRTCQVFWPPQGIKTRPTLAIRNTWVIGCGILKFSLVLHVLLKLKPCHWIAQRWAKVTCRWASCNSSSVCFVET